jgi:hypothetical protein
MYLRIIILFLVVVVFSTMKTNAQFCQGFHKSSRCFIDESKDFKQYGQARSAAIEVGQLYKCQVLLYGKKDYIFSICSEQGYKPIHFRLTDSDKNEVIYDNADDNYNRSIGFSMEKTTTVNVEVEILVKDEVKKKDPTNYRVCMGIQIWWRKIPKLGFE